MSTQKKNIRDAFIHSRERYNDLAWRGKLYQMKPLLSGFHMNGHMPECYR